MINSAEANGRTPFRPLSVLNVTALAGCHPRISRPATGAFSGLSS
jgi:hypothetical protein